MNVFVPPRNIGYGWGTTDEMMNLVMYFLLFRKGDEEISLEK
jgi:hypothetical protein